MSRIYYAHSGNEPDKSDWQPLADHLKKVGRIAEENARYFDAAILAINQKSRFYLFSGIDISQF